MGTLHILMIEVEHLVKRYGPVPAVNDISFAIERGEIVGFLGPNGAGKSTTMRILTGYLPATSGRAAVAGHDLHRDSLAARRHIGYLPEGVVFYPELRVHEYLNYRARIKGVRGAERRKRLDAVLDRCRIADVRRKLIGSLSKGYRQRVGLADALIHDPPVLILDEPTIGLDPNQIRQVRDLIRDLGRDHTVLISTHILPEVEMTCSRVLLIHRGRLVFRDRLDNLAEGMHVLVELKGPADDAAEQLRKIDGVAEATVLERGEWSRLHVTTGKGKDAREAIAACVASNHWPLRELRQERLSLEEAFVRLTAEEEG